VNPHYFHRLLLSKIIYNEFARLAPGSTVKNLNIDLVRGVRLPVAEAAQQASFARRVVAVEAVADRLAQSLTLVEALASALQHRAFTGRL
jgi:type I restriction enzyme S subunit